MPQPVEQEGDVVTMLALGLRNESVLDGNKPLHHQVSGRDSKGNNLDERDNVVGIKYADTAVTVIFFGANSTRSAMT